MENIIESGIIGMAIGDALGVPVEFYNRYTLQENPVVDFREYGSHYQPKASWSDDTSMALCLWQVIRDENYIDYEKIMKNFILWANEGAFTSHGTTFDIGNTVSNALYKFEDGVTPLKCGGDRLQDNGNGSLMRILPLAFYLSTKYKDENLREFTKEAHIHNISKLTHGHPISCIACELYVEIALFIIQEKQNQPILKNKIQNIVSNIFSHYRYEPYIQDFYKIQNIHKLANMTEDEIDSDGYVINTLTASIWCLITTNNYKDCVLKAVNLGGDTDTTGAVVGGLAGLLYGLENIPNEWVSEISKIYEFI